MRCSVVVSLVLLLVASPGIGRHLVFAQNELESISTIDSNETPKMIDVESQDHSKPITQRLAFFKMQSVLSDHYMALIKRNKDLAGVYYDNGHLDQAIKYAHIGLRYCNRFQHQREMVSLNNLLGLSYYALGRFEEAYNVYLKALSFAAGDSVNLGKVYNNMGNVLSDLDELEKGLGYFQQAAIIGNRYQDLNLLAASLVNLAIYYKQQGELTSAFLYTDSARQVAARHGDLNLVVGIMINQANLLCANGEAKKALAMLSGADSLLWHPKVEAMNKQGLNFAFGFTNYFVGDYRAARHFLRVAKEGSRVKDGLGSILFRLSQTHVMLGAYKDAYFTYRQYKEIEDSIASDNIKLRVNELETQYRTAQKDKTIAEGRLKIQAQKLRLNRQRNWIGGLVGGSLLVLLLASWRYSHIRQKNRRLQSQMEVEQLKAEMAGEQRERARIASELHDGIVAELTAIKMNLEVAGNRLSEAPIAYRTHLKELSTVINEVRNTAHNLMPEILLRHGLAEAVGLLCETIEKTGRLKVEYQHYGDFTAIAQTMRQSVYRIIQELLHNIIKHARASKALLQLSCNDGLLAIELEDNGIGIKVESGFNMGLSGIERRVSEFNGRVEWASPESGSGTQVLLEFEL